jgi:hypothetical protein
MIMQPVSPEAAVKTAETARNARAISINEKPSPLDLCADDSSKGSRQSPDNRQEKSQHKNRANNPTRLVDAVLLHFR